MCEDGIHRGSLIVYPWIAGWPRICEVVGYGRYRIERLAREHVFPLRYGPSGEARVHPPEIMEWILPPDQWQAAEERRNQVGIPYKDSPLLGLERIFLTGWYEISWYLGYKSHVTAQRFVKDYDLPVYFKARRARALPAAIDAFFISWDKIMKEKRVDYYRKRKAAGGRGHH
jgi:hypothetical protein